MFDLYLLQDKYVRFLGDLSEIFQHLNELKYLSLVSIFFLCFLIYSFYKISCLASAKFEIHNKFKKKDIFLFVILNIFLLLLMVLLFPINVPFVDDWIYLNNNYYNNNLFNFFFALEGNHSFLFYKILGFLNFTFLHSSQQFFNLFAVFLLGITAFIFLKSDLLEKKDNIIKFIFFAILFSPKQIINITQSVNLIWLFFLFFTALFASSVSSKKISTSHSLSIIFSPLSIGSGITVPVYSFFTNIFQSEKKNYFCVFLSVISLLIILYLLPKFSDFSIIKSTSFIEEINTHFSLLNLFGLPVVIANIFAPPHFYFYPLPMFIGVIQLFFLIKFEFNNLMNFKGIKKFILENPLIIIGLMSSILIILFRHFPDYLSARYSTISIVFQLGFLLWIFKAKVSSVIKKISVYLYFFCYGLSWFLPYEGFFQHLSKFYQSANVESCYKNAIDTNQTFDLCNDYAYKTLFYGGTWYDRTSFEKSITFLHDNNLSFFYKLSGESKSSESKNNK